MKKVVLLLLLYLSALTAVAAEPLLDKPIPDAGMPVEEGVAGPYQSPLNSGLELQYSPMSFPHYEFTSQRRQVKPGHAVRAALEWLPIQHYGKLGIGGSAGFFVSPDNPTIGDAAATLYVVPLEAFLSYHFDYWVDQLLVPYARLGTGLSFAGQGSRSGGMTIGGMQSYYGWNYAVGLQLNLSNLDPRASKRLDASIGINTTYLIAEWAASDFLAESRAPNLSSQALRFGLRFEM